MAPSGRRENVPSPSRRRWPSVGGLDYDRSCPDCGALADSADMLASHRRNNCPLPGQCLHRRTATLSRRGDKRRWIKVEGWAVCRLCDRVVEVKCPVCEKPMFGHPKTRH